MRSPASVTPPRPCSKRCSSPRAQVDEREGEPMTVSDAGRAGVDAFAVGPARRALDVLVAGMLLLVCLPLLLLVATLIAVTDGRPVFFTQDRVGEGSRPFRLYKLRSMRVGAGPAVTVHHDTRVTRVGAFLRRTSIDELPQLWHVLRGQMTLVGPRPESVELASRWPDSCRQLLTVRPGLTGPAQLRYRERSAVPPEGWTVEEWYLNVLMPERTHADLEFLARPTLARTVGYLWETVLFVVGLTDPERTVNAPEGGRPAPSRLRPRGCPGRPSTGRSAH